MSDQHISELMAKVGYLKLALVASLCATSFTGLGNALSRAVEGVVHSKHTTSTPTVGGKAQAGLFSGGFFRKPVSAADLRQASREYAALVPDEFAVVRYAFGDANNPMQFSSELEGSRLEVVEFYRPEAVSEEKWLAMSPPLRRREAASIGQNRWDNWVRLSTAPNWMRNKLAIEADGSVWEITNHTYAETLSEAWEQAGFLRRATHEDAFHHHVTFFPERSLADEITAFLSHVDLTQTSNMYNRSASWRAERLQQATTRSGHGLRFSNVAHRFLGPHPHTQLLRIRHSIAAGDARQEKMHSVGLRSRGIYGSSGRIGYEFRAGTALPERIAPILRRTVEFLENPAGTNLRIQDDGPSFFIEDLKNLDGLRSTSIDRIGGETMSRSLRKIENAGNSDRPPLQRYQAIRWGYPMVRWEERPHLVHLEAKIKAARERYVNEVGEIVQRYIDTGEPNADHSFADQMSYAVERFVHDSQIASSY